MAYDVLALIIGIPAAIAATCAAIDMSRNRFHVVGFGGSGEKTSQPRETQAPNRADLTRLGPEEQGTVGLEYGTIAKRLLADQSMPAWEKLVTGEVVAAGVAPHEVVPLAPGEKIVIEGFAVTGVAPHHSHFQFRTARQPTIKHVKAQIYMEPNENQASEDQARMAEYHSYKLHELEERIRRLEKQSSREWEQAANAASTKDSSTVIN